MQPLNLWKMQFMPFFRIKYVQVFHMVFVHVQDEDFYLHSCIT